jgi:hypothetical protein
VSRRAAARLTLAASLVAVFATPAAGQRVQQVEGGGSFNDAPIVAPGRYTDTIRPKERLFYAIEVQPGQKLKARAVIEGTLSTDDSPIRSEMRMHNPTRDEIPGQLAIHQVWSRDSKLRLTGDKVGGGEQFFSEPGLYYVAIALGTGRRSQFDVDLKFTLKGTPVEPDPTPSEEPSPTGDATPEGEPTEDPTPAETQQPPAGSGAGSASPPTGGDDELPVGLFVGFFVAGALGGSAIELFRGARARA